MMQQNNIGNLTSALRACGQEHLLRFWDELDEKGREHLLGQIQQLDCERIPDWVRNYVLNESPIEVPKDFDPAPHYPAQPQSDEHRRLYQKARQVGEKLLSEGKVAGFVVAGGQGTRLGFNGPKGNFKISPIRNKTLFRIFAEYIAAARKKYNAMLPWYIMTSPLNNQATKEIFEAENYYGLGADSVCIFQQGTMPNFDFSGKIFLADKDTLAESPDGHGGSLKALMTGGAVADMRRRGVEYISYWQVDNPLIHVFDPLFIGLHVLDGSEMSSKGLKKAHPLEKVGNFCIVNGKVTVIEYSDLDETHAHKRNPDGPLAFDMGSIGIHMISVSFVEKLNAGGGFALPFHRAVKKIPHIDENGNPVEPTKPNGIKLETFVFDALPLAKHSTILETLRCEEFAPVKNAEGADSPAVTRRMMVERAACWLEQAGVKVPRKSDGTPDCAIEIAPSFALTADDVKAKKDQVPPIQPGSTIYLE